MTTLQDAILAAEQALTDLDAAGAMFDALCNAKRQQLAAEAAAQASVEATFDQAARLADDARRLVARLDDAFAHTPLLARERRFRLGLITERARERYARRQHAATAALQAL